MKLIIRASLLIGGALFTLLLGSILFAAYDRKLFIQTVEGWHVASNDLTNFVLSCAKQVEYAAKHPTVKEMRSQLLVCFRSIFASILNIYKTICQEFPIYYDVVKSKFI